MHADCVEGVAGLCGSSNVMAEVCLLRTIVRNVQKDREDRMENL